MKKFGIYFMMLAMMMAVTFVACNKNDDDPIKNPDITISKIVLDEADLDAFEFNVSVIAYEELTSVKYYVLYETAEMVPVTITSFEKGAKTWAKKFDASDFATVIPLLGGLPEGAVLKFVVEVITASTSADKTEPIEIIRIPEPDPPLEGPKDFTWNRKGTNDGTGLSEFGLAWKKNTATNIVITPLDGAKLVVLKVEDWTLITTKKELAEAVEAGTGVTQWDVIPTKSTFNYVIATKTKEGKYFMLNPTERIINDTNTGDRSVKGKYKY